MQSFFLSHDASAVTSKIEKVCEDLGFVSETAKYDACVRKLAANEMLTPKKQCGLEFHKYVSPKVAGCIFEINEQVDTIWTYKRSNTEMSFDECFRADPAAIEIGRKNFQIQWLEIMYSMISLDPLILLGSHLTKILI